MKKVIFNTLIYSLFYLIIILLLFPTISFGQTPEQNLTNEKIKKEIKLLDKQTANEENKGMNIIVTYFVPAIVTIAGSIIGTFTLWWKEKRKEAMEQKGRLELENQKHLKTLELENQKHLKTLELENQKHLKTLELENEQQLNKLELEYDINLRGRRITAYEKLWPLTKIDINPSSSSQDIDKIREELHEWYYTNGNGMLLTEFSQKLYHNLKDRIEDTTEHWDNVDPSQKADLQKVRMIDSIKQLASGFRTSLTIDIGGREDPKILSTYGNLKIIEPYGQDIKINPDDEQKIVIKYFGTGRMDIPDGKIYLRILNLDKWNNIALLELKLKTVEPGYEGEFIWNYKDSKEEIFGDKESVYILLKVLIKNYSVVQTFQFKK